MIALQSCHSSVWVLAITCCCCLRDAVVRRMDPAQLATIDAETRKMGKYESNARN